MIRYVEINDKKEWYDLDRHLPENVFDEKVRTKQGYVLVEDEKIIGLLRYNLFWDNTPFCTMLFIEDSYRCKGIWQADDGTLGAGYESSGLWYADDIYTG